MPRAETVAPRPIPTSFIFLLAFAIHAPLLLMKLPLKSYDTNFHIFFASHYVHHWFDPWNSKWYAGFTQTTYPPLPQQWLALVSYITGLDMAYMVVQFVAILLLTLGVYRFARLWVDPRAASLAAVASVFLGAESFLVYSAGQLSTTFAAPLYLNAMPYLYQLGATRRLALLLQGSDIGGRGRRCASRHADFRIFAFRPPRVGAGVARREGRRTSIDCRLHHARG